MTYTMNIGGHVIFHIKMYIFGVQDFENLLYLAG